MNLVAPEIESQDYMLNCSQNPESPIPSNNNYFPWIKLPDKYN
jgi:hypothetical protein